MKRFGLILTLLLYGFAAMAQDIVIENDVCRLAVSENGYAKSLICKASGEECLAEGRHIPLCTITQYRPYDNENFLMFPAKPMTFPSENIRYESDTLYVRFKDTYDIAVIAVDVKPTYIGFTLARRDYVIEDFGVKRKTELDEFALLQLPVKEMDHFGAWLNVSWNDASAVCVMGTSPETRIDTYHYRDGERTMYAGAENRVRMLGVGAALVAGEGRKVLDGIADVERDYGLPKGVESRRAEEYAYSYYEVRDVTVDNVEEHIAYAMQGGFHSMVIYYMDFASTCGHFLWREEYPDGLEDLKEVVSKIRAAGMVPGFHIHYSKVSTDDPYICDGTPDHRLNSAKELMLASPLGKQDRTIWLEGGADGLRMEEGRRLLMIGDEFISYEAVSGQSLIGCERGVFNTQASEYAAGTRFFQPDVDDWPRFIRVDQNSGIQKEIAERLAEIYDSCGFDFIYFDGAEDVPEPYWYNVSRAQNAVMDAVKRPVLFAEGAQKSHFGWHILTRGNAFDLFRPERFRAGMKKYTLRAARQIADDFTSVDFGWLDSVAPDSTTIGMQPDMYDYACSKSVAWNSPISYVAKLDEMARNPRNAENLAAIRRWETARLKGIITDEQKEMMKDPDREFTLIEDKSGNLTLLEWHQITPDDMRPIRAFGYEKDGKSFIVYWSVDNRSGKMKTISSKLPMKEFEASFLRNL